MKGVMKPRGEREFLEDVATAEQTLELLWLYYWTKAGESDREW
jgi:hypothetical protein